VEDGHTESVSVRLKTKAKREEIIAAWNDYRAEPQELKLPSAPVHPLVYLEANDRPQPRLDVDLGAGMTAAALRRAGLEVHRAFAQHHSWSRWGGRVECGIAEGPRLPTMTSGAKVALPSRRLWRGRLTRARDVSTSATFLQGISRR